MDHPAGDTSEIDRRTLLSSIASASGVGVGVASITDDTTATSTGTTTTKITGEQRERVLDEALNDARTEELLTANLADDREVTEAKVVRSSYGATDWRVVTATIESESDAEVTVFWSDHEEMEPTATVTAPGSDSGAAELRAIETPTAGVIPIGINPCGWGDMLSPDCVIETGYVYAEEIAVCGRCASKVSEEIRPKPKNRKQLLLAIARVAPSCGSCLVKAIREYDEHGIPCDLCVPEEEVGLEGDDTVSV